jgi:DNA polymerase elongation subunit (family B)
MERSFRIFDFNVYSEKNVSCDESSNDEENNTYKDNSQFLIQIFGLDESGKTCSIIVEEFKPFFYVLVEENWNITKKNQFLEHLKQKMGKYYQDSITECIIVKRKKLYGFDGGKEHKFIKLEFSNLNAFNKAKNLWYSPYGDDGRKLLKNGYLFNGTFIKIYESNIPPLLRFFHIRDISPSGWIALPNKKTTLIREEEKKTNCDFEFIIQSKNIVPLNNTETRVPYKICSFDIEASSSHGDFPVPVKTYKKLATNIIEYFEKTNIDLTRDSYKNILKQIILTAFGFGNIINDIDLVYPKPNTNISIKTKEDVEKLCEKWFLFELRNASKNPELQELNTLEKLFEKMGQQHQNDNDIGNDDENEEYPNNQYYQNKKNIKSNNNLKATIIDILSDKTLERENKLNQLNLSLNAIFPRLEGDKVTFIGSTFTKYGQSEPYLNHCIVLNTCADLPIENTEIESYKTEKDVLLAWSKIIQKENPDIIIGYNIFGFDYEFMFRRAEENNCIEDFLKLSRNKNEICAVKNQETGKYKMEETSIQIASGQHDLKFIKMNGRLQVDLYNFFRREENLTSYKLDYVAGHFIGDYIKNIEHNNTENTTKIKTTNMTGLLEGSFVHLEEIGHSVDYYENGAKFKVNYVNKKEGIFIIDSIVNPDLKLKKVRWCLAKDDVTPKDIFRMTNGTAEDRSVIAKYCIQDCNLVHYLFNKADILTGFIEMAKICSVPINFLVMRGQGIKLTSYIAKKCREKRTLMPVIEKGGLDEGYEGAIVLNPKCDLYLDNPVACVDYASLYPSSMISENLSHDSKVWTKEYDLAGNLLEETGEKDENGNFIYDNLPDYEYVNVTYDTYRYIRKTPTSAAEKVKSGLKICRFAQFPEGKAIMPSILEELLKARKDTRKMIPLETDEFMKNVLDKRQLGYKVTANSLYGQCGAKTSTFYEKDIAACTTATGRMLLTYAKRIIEECYGDSICNTKDHGPVLTKAEYIYGDTDSVFFTFNLQTPEGQPIRGKEALEITIELAQEAGHLASSFLKGPHDLEYEKTFMPFCLLSKKRYVGMLYETDPNKCKRKEMGIVLKRRDNAPIVKDIYGGIIDILMKQQNIQQATEFLKSCLQNMVDEKYPMEKLIITKSLRSGYKNPQSIAHKVLADRITARDPGNKPGSGDRIPFVYIHNSNKKALQGEKIETPNYIIENRLKIDYSFYITNQIMKPVQQVFALVLEKIWEMQNKKSKISNFKKEIETLKKTYSGDEEKFETKLEQLKNKEVKALLFDKYLRETNNEKEGNQSLTKFFIKK